MFSSLDLSPMLILLLLVYGLLIAFSLFAWTALNLRQRTRSAQQAEQHPERQGAPGRPSERGSTADQQRTSARRSSPLPPARPEPEVHIRMHATRDDQRTQQKPWLRTPDAEASQPESVSQMTTAAPREPAPIYVHPERLPVTRLAASEPPPVQPDPALQKTVRPEPTLAPLQDGVVRLAPEAPAGRPRNEDAFERFLRSSRNDPED